MNNKVMWIVVALVVVVGAIFYFNRAPSTIEDGTSSTSQNGTSNSTAGGRVVFSVTDAAADMSTISEVSLKVSKVEMRNSAGGWVTVSTTAKTYDLLALNASGESMVLADVKAEAGTYDQVRLMVDSVTVRTKAGATAQAKLPSGELKINTEVVVKDNTTTSVHMDFLADRSLHMTGNGSYIFAPVVKTEAKSEASVSVSGSGKVSIAGGKTDDTNVSGMDVDGTVKVNFELKSDVKLNVGNDGKIKIDL